MPTSNTHTSILSSHSMMISIESSGAYHLIQPLLTKLTEKKYVELGPIANENNTWLARTSYPSPWLDVVCMVLQDELMDALTAKDLVLQHDTVHTCKPIRSSPAAPNPASAKTMAPTSCSNNDQQHAIDPVNACDWPCLAPLDTCQHTCSFLGHA
jgi:hypothetical protein